MVRLHRSNILGQYMIGQINRSSSTLTRYYYLKDHLGSTKMMVDASGTVASYDDYYPFGLTMPGRSMVNVDPRWRFTGKEKSNNWGRYLFGARTYNPLIGRWDQVDPSGDKYPYLSPFSYVANNPLILFDPNGKKIKYIGTKKEVKELQDW